MRKLLKQVENEILNRNISRDEISDILSTVPVITNRRVIGGYASVSILDREGHRITIPALKEAVKRFMSEEFFRPCTVFHSDIQVGRILPKWTHPDTGKIYRTEVDDIGWYTLVELRNDLEIADKVWEEILKGNIKSFSIAGSSKEKKEVFESGRLTWDIDKLDIYECALCETPVNPLSTFEVLWNPEKVLL